MTNKPVQRKTVRVKVKVKKKGPVSVSPSAPTEQSRPLKSVLVIGAGIAGISAAQALQLSGLKVTVVEGRDRIGGRIWTEHRFGFPIDLGASWLYGIRNNPISRLVKQNMSSLIATCSDDFAVFDDAGRQADPQSLARFSKELQEFIHQLHRQGKRLVHDISMAEALTQHFDKDPLSDYWQKVLTWRFSQWEMLFGTALPNLSLKHFDGLNTEEQDAIVKDGFGKIIECMAKNLTIRFNQRVKAIHYFGDQVAVITDNDRFQADCVLLTVPLGVLKQGDIQFIPELPVYKRQAINRLGMGSLNKVVLVFSHVCWPENHQFIGYMTQQKQNIPIFLNLYPLLNQPALVGFIGAPDVPHFESMTDEAILQQVLQMVSRFAPNQKLSQLVGYHITRWNSDPFSRGAFSFIPPGVDTNEMNHLARPIANKLFFAGEATIADHSTTVQGAYLSGLREAKRILTLYKSK